MSNELASRREFLRGAGRWLGAAGLVGLLAWVERPREGGRGICLDNPICANCPALSKCDRPSAVQEKNTRTEAPE